MKNNNLMEYKGYYGSVLVSVDDEVMHGKIECISDVVTYEADNIPELKAAFHEAVDDYIETCLELGKEPEKTLSGTFNIRIGSDLHKTVYIKAKGAGISINDFVRRPV